MAPFGITGRRSRAAVAERGGGAGGAMRRVATR
jgi:hypothetical protein